ncbi:hypothetical protein [Nocardia sp. NBC_01009]|nr:hypothetical protein OHA42_17155 [Nocardia sp. NBC_01009]
MTRSIRVLRSVVAVRQADVDPVSTSAEADHTQRPGELLGRGLDDRPYS